MTKLYYNRKLIGDVLLVVIDEEKLPTRYIKKDDVVAIYSDDKLIGINILNFSSICRIFHEGEIEEPSSEFIKLVNHIVINAGLEPLKIIF